MKDHNGVLMMQRALLAGTLGLAMARKAAAILEGEPGTQPPGAEGAQSPPPRARSRRRRGCGAAGDPGRGERLPRALR